MPRGPPFPHRSRGLMPGSQAMAHGGQRFLGPGAQEKQVRGRVEGGQSALGCR